MSSLFKIAATSFFFLFSGFAAMSQLSNQGVATNYGGGTVTGGSFTNQISTGQFGGVPKSENSGIYIGLVSFNMESGVVTINASDANGTIADNIEGILLRIQPLGNYDTLDVISNSGGSFSFNPVFLGNYLVNIDSDPDKFVATYYGDSFLWEEADTLTVNADTTVEVSMSLVPPELTPTDGDGTVSGTIEEDFEDDGARINARRRAAKRKCGLRRKRSGGRTGQETDEFELIAYGETNDNGEFEYGFLPQGTYRFFVEYPGIPLDESSFVQFDVGEAGVSDNSFVLAAVVTEDGIKVELILGITSEFFTDFNIYPNPTTDLIHIEYDKIVSEKLTMSLIDINGKSLLSKELSKSENGTIQIDMREYQTGHYILRFIDNERNKTALTFRILKK